MREREEKTQQRRITREKMKDKRRGKGEREEKKGQTEGSLDDLMFDPRLVAKRKRKRIKRDTEGKTDRWIGRGR